MMVVLFEFEVRDGQGDAYFGLAEKLRADLEKVDGFIAIERFESRTTEGKFMSMSLWRDEAAVRGWREAAGHRQGQIRGRTDILSGYHIRVAEVVRDYGFGELTPSPSAKRHLRAPRAAPLPARREP